MAEKSGFSKFWSGRSDQLLLTKEDFAVLRENVALLKDKYTEFKERISVVDLEALRTIFASRMAKIILDRNEMAVTVFLCGTYVADLLTAFASASPASWYFMDYLIANWKENRCLNLKCGGDACFLLCSLFKEKSDKRAMNCRDYELQGRGLYRPYYDHTGMEVAYHMSQQFSPMVKITHDCLQNFKQ